MTNIHPYLIPAMDVYEINKQMPTHTSPTAIKYQVAKYYAAKDAFKINYGDVDAHDVERMIESKSRKKEIKNARFCACYFLKNMTDLNLKTIGKMIGHRDHSTVIHAVKSYENECTTNKLALNDHIEMCAKFKVPNKIKFFK